MSAKVGQLVKLTKPAGWYVDLTEGGIYTVIELDCDDPADVIVIDDAGDRNIIFLDEYEVVE